MMMLIGNISFPAFSCALMGEICQQLKIVGIHSFHDQMICPKKIILQAALALLCDIIIKCRLSY